MQLDWAIDLDIKSFFDEIDHDLMLKHWVILPKQAHSLVRKTLVGSLSPKERWYEFIHEAKAHRKEVL